MAPFILSGTFWASATRSSFFVNLNHHRRKKTLADEEKILRGALFNPYLSVQALELLTPGRPPSQGSGLHPMDMSYQYVILSVDLASVSSSFGILFTAFLNLSFIVFILFLLWLFLVFASLFSMYFIEFIFISDRQVICRMV